MSSRRLSIGAAKVVDALRRARRMVEGCMVENNLVRMLFPFVEQKRSRIRNRIKGRKG
jgi:hypothetical protein